MHENMETFFKKYDMLAADEKSLELLKTFTGEVQKVSFPIQSASEIAEIVKNIILSDKPNLRYQTNDKFHPDEVKAKLADPTGNVLVEMLNKKYLDTE